MTTLKMAISRTTGRRIVEVYSDTGRFIATICPTDDGSNSVHIVSEHFDDEPFSRAPHGFLSTPSFLIRFKGALVTSFESFKAAKDSKS